MSQLYSWLGPVAAIGIRALSARSLGLAPVSQLVGIAQYAIEAGLGSNINALIGQCGNNLIGGHRAKGFPIGNLQNALPL
jgi:hypothetical protein